MTAYSRRPLIGIALVLAIYYIVLAVNGQRVGFHTTEALFLTEKALIVWQGVGDKVSVLGLTFPIFSFFFSLPFSAFLPLLGPVIASSLGMALLFFLVVDDQRLRNIPVLIQVGTGLSFAFHPGLVFTAVSGQSTYTVLLFGYLFFRSLLMYYQSNTTYHVSMASLFLLGLVFSEVDFAWLCLFLLPLILFISLQSLSLRGEDTLLRLELAFNNVSLRRKLINKSLALAILLFMLPLVSLVVFSLLNRIYTGDPRYFLENPYANSSVITDQLFRQQFVGSPTDVTKADTPMLISLGRLVYAPLMLLMLLSFRGRTYQLLTLLSPLLLVEFLHVKDPLVPAQLEFYQIFMMLGWAGLTTISVAKLRQKKELAFALMLVQIGVGTFYQLHSSYAEERSFMRTLSLSGDSAPNDDARLIQFVQQLPADKRILTDDATAYPFIARTERIRPFILVYQQNYLPALDNPQSFTQYILTQNVSDEPKAQFSMVNKAYIGRLQRKAGQQLSLVMKSNDWSIYSLTTPEKQRQSLNQTALLSATN
jgi:hypothetical protein